MDAEIAKKVNRDSAENAYLGTNLRHYSKAKYDMNKSIKPSDGEPRIPLHPYFLAEDRLGLRFNVFEIRADGPVNFLPPLRIDFRTGVKPVFAHE